MIILDRFVPEGTLCFKTQRVVRYPYKVCIGLSSGTFSVTYICFYVDVYQTATIRRREVIHRVVGPFNAKRGSKWAVSWEEFRSLGSSVCMKADGRHQSVPGVEVFVKFAV
jgi:hypothetical protein